MYLENNEVKKYPLAAIVAWLLVILWMSIIFMLSHQSREASSQLSSKIAMAIVFVFKNWLNPSQLDKIESILRVLAHGFVFYILAIFVSRAFESINVKDLNNAALTLVLCALYAVSDEVHQIFVPGRAGQIKDFLTDLAGIFLAIVTYQLIRTAIDLKSALEVKT